jgi:membrane fusion protein, heavy metal efflux system
MKNSILNPFIVFATLVAIYSCGHKNQQDNSNADLSITGDSVSISDNSPVLSKLTLQTATQQDYTSQCITTATVKPISGHLAEVSSPFEGRIVKSFVKLGEKVSSGTPLFEVNSNEYFEAVKAFLQAKQTKLLSEKNLQRKKDLAANGVSSKKELEEAETDFTIAQKECEKAEATLRIFNVNADDVNMAKPLVVRSPISGEVVKNNITVGQYQKTDGESVVTIAELEKVWVVARVKEKNIGQITRQDKVLIYTESLPEKPIEGFVDYIGNMMDEQTRSVEVYIECNNHEKTLKPGMFVTTSFGHKISNAIVVPSSAVLQQEDKSYVFVQIGKNKFCKKPVTVFSNGDDKHLVVSAGIDNGSIIVTDGGIYLR